MIVLVPDQTLLTTWHIFFLRANPWETQYTPSSFRFGKFFRFMCFCACVCVSLWKMRSFRIRFGAVINTIYAEEYLSHIRRISDVFIFDNYVTDSVLYGIEVEQSKSLFTLVFVNA